MKHSTRSDSERSDETSGSQETTSTNLSDNDCFALTDNNNMSDAHKNRNIMPFVLEGFHKKDESNVLYFGPPSNNNTVNKAETIDGRTIGFQNKERNKTSIGHGQRQFNRPTCTCGTIRGSGEVEALLEQESIDPTESIYSEPVSAVSNDTSGYLDLIPLEKTCPRDINDHTYNHAGGRKNFPELERDYNEIDKDLEKIQDNYNGLQVSYRKVWRILLALAVFDLILMISMITVTTIVVIPREPIPTATLAPVDRGATYNICFDCADLERDSDFSADSLRGLYKKHGSCCFDSISSVYLSFKQVFQNQIEDRLKTLNFSLTSLQSLTLNVLAEKRNISTEYIIGRILSLNAPKEKTAVHLVSAEGKPEKVVTMSGVFHKVRWDPGDSKGERNIVRGKAHVWDGLNVQVQSEGYYFLYTRLHFKAEPGDRDVTINYNINRQRGSTSTYIHEAKERCIGSSLEHNGVAEMVVHLKKYDEIFISVSPSNIQFLSTEVGAHMIGLFEL